MIYMVKPNLKRFLKTDFTSRVVLIPTVILLFMVFFLFSSCTKNETEGAGDQASAENTEMEKKTVEVEELGFSIDVPETWKKLGGDKLREAKRQAQEGPSIGVFTIDIVDSYHSDHNGSITISKLTADNDDFRAPANVVDEFIAGMKRHFADQYTIQKEESTIGPFKAIFLQMYNDQFFIVKTVYFNDAERIFQIDFIIPRNNLTEALLKEVEDALLSVKKI